MKRRQFGMLAFGCAMVLVGGVAAAEKLDDATLGITLEAPEGFLVPPQKPPIPDLLGEVKGFYASPKFEDTAAFAMVHQMPRPDGVTFEQFKETFPARIGAQLGNSYKQVRQEDVEAGKLKGFVFEFEAPGNGMLPEAGGSFRHRVRWYFFPQGADRLIGIVYHSRETAWKELEPKFAASFKSLKDK